MKMLHLPRPLSQSAACAMLVLILWCAYGYARQFSGPNQNSRLSMLHAMVTEHRMAIDTYERSTVDKAFFRGHYYSDKAPGTALLALPAYVAGWILLLAAHFCGLELPNVWDASAWFATTGSVGALSAVAGGLFFLLLCDYVRRRDAFLSTIAVFVGSGMFTYATMLFSHAESASLMVIALWLVLKKRTNRASFFAGLCAGLSVACEYPTVLIAVALLPLVAREGRRAVLAYMAGACVPLGLFLLLHTWVFGTPFFVGYAYTVWPAPADLPASVLGFSHPSLSRMVFLLLSPMRGLFFWSPFLLLAAAGVTTLYRRDRILTITILAVTTVYISVIGSHVEPSGGSALGPRHLTPLVPLLGILAAVGFSRYRLLGTPLLVGSLALTGVGTIISAMPPQGSTNPLVEYYLPVLLQGRIAPNLGVTAGLGPYASILLPSVLLAICAGWMWLNLKSWYPGQESNLRPRA